MDTVDAGFKAFLGYTISQKEVNAAAKDTFKAENPLPPKEEKPKKSYKPRKYNPSKMERKMIEAGKAEIQDNKLVILTEPEPTQVPEFSHLLAEPMTIDQVLTKHADTAQRRFLAHTTDIDF